MSRSAQDDNGLVEAAGVGARSTRARGRASLESRSTSKATDRSVRSTLAWLRSADGRGGCLHMSWDAACNSRFLARLRRARNDKTLGARRIAGAESPHLFWMLHAALKRRSSTVLRAAAWQSESRARSRSKATDRSVRSTRASLRSADSPFDSAQGRRGGCLHMSWDAACKQQVPRPPSARSE